MLNLVPRRSRRVSSTGMAPGPDRQDERDQANRLWSHALHQDEEFVQRSNFFLVAESLLVVAYSSLLTSGLHVGAVSGDERLLLTARVIGVFGFLLSVIWCYACMRLKYVMSYLDRRTEEVCPEFRRTNKERKMPGRIRSTWLMTYIVPALTGIMWVMFVAITF
jgi:hypothetical protein